MENSNKEKVVKATKEPKVAKTQKAKKTESTEVANALNASVFNLEGAVEKNVQLPEELFNTEVNKTLIAQYIRVYRTNQRQGTVSTKTRSEVIGTTKKIYRQKGTGRARHGAAKAPIFVGGGITFGPKPRDFDLKMNKKQKRQAFLSALTLKAQESNVLVFSQAFETMEPKTKVFATTLKNMGMTDDKAIVIVAPEKSIALKKASRNVKTIDVKHAGHLNAYDVLSHKKVVFTEEALQVLKDLIQA